MRQRNWAYLSLALKKDIVSLIDTAGTGHIGGSMSSLDVLLVLYDAANISPANMEAGDRDRIIISMGHISPAYYCVLAAYGFISKEELFKNYRRNPGIFEGHPNNLAPGVEWCNGCLGQGLSQGCGEAIALKMLGYDKSHVYVLMGDGEQSKGQIQEAIELAAKEELSNLTVIVDMNGQQSSGRTKDVLSVPIAKRYLSAGWSVMEIDGHNHEEIYQAVETARASAVPTCILARTVMGKDIPGIENDWHYHGKLLSSEQVRMAMKYLDGLMDGLEKEELPLRRWNGETVRQPVDTAKTLNGCDQYHIYRPEDQIDGRTVCARTLQELAEKNPRGSMCILDCDLAGSLKIDQINRTCPGTLLECGIQEHNAMSAAGGIAACGIKTFYMGFGMFSLAEPFNQLRVIDQNHIPLKIIATHCGLDVGQDGKSHQMIDYIALSNALLGSELILPADPNQTDRALRYLANTEKTGILALPRSPFPVLQRETGEVLFDENYRFQYGNADWIRRGHQAVIVTYGIMVQKALKARDILQKEGISCGILNISAPKSLDVEKIRQAAQTGLIVVIEDHNIHSGLGSMIGTFLAQDDSSCKFFHLGVKQYGISASPEKQFEYQHLTSDDLVNAIRQNIKK